MEFKGKKVLVVGLGRSGLSAAKYLCDRGAEITITDSKSEAQLINELKELNHKNIKQSHNQTINYHFGSNPPHLFGQSELVVLSPGVPLDIEGVKIARSAGVPVVCEMELGLGEISGKVIAITGTNGKSTTTELIGDIFKLAGRKAWVGGNIGRPLIGDIAAAKNAEYVVLEVSSYQLELTPSLKPFIGVLLNITPDHLDRYETYGAYIEAKALIGRNQNEGDYMVYNADDKLVCEKINNFKSKKVPFSKNNVSVEIKNPGLAGVHNMENVSAALMVAQICEIPKKIVQVAVNNFKGLPHRLQFVKERGGVKYYDDSKGTNVGAVIRSLESFREPVILIAGGQDKNTGYEDLKTVLKGVRAIVAIGEAAQKIKNELGGKTEVIISKTMKSAVIEASKLARPGDVVLLSPACASFDMFKNYGERGDVFVKCVEEL